MSILLTTAKANMKKESLNAFKVLDTDYPTKINAFAGTVAGQQCLGNSKSYESSHNQYVLLCGGRFSRRNSS